MGEAQDGFVSLHATFSAPSKHVPQPVFFNGTVDPVNMAIRIPLTSIDSPS